MTRANIEKNSEEKVVTTCGGTITIDVDDNNPSVVGKLFSYSRTEGNYCKRKIAKFLTSVIVSHRLTSSTNSMIESFEKIIQSIYGRARR